MRADAIGNRGEKPLQNHAGLNPPAESGELQKADGDDILENNEMFTLVVNPAITVPANGVFELTLNTDTNRAFDMKFGVPPEIRKYGVVKLRV